MTVVGTTEGGEGVVLSLIGSDLRLVLFVAQTAGPLTKLADLTYPTDPWYSEILLPEANWFGSGNSREFGQQTFTADATTTNPVVYGHAIYSFTNSSLVLLDEYDTPVQMTNGATIDITPVITVS